MGNMDEFPLTDPEHKGFEPSQATLWAWTAQAYMLEYKNSEPGTEQAEVAHQQANSAFGEMVIETQNSLQKSAWLRTRGSDDEIDEIIQNTYERAYKYLPKFRGDSQIETWLHSIMFKRISSYYDKKARDKHLSLDALLNETNPLSETLTNVDPSTEEIVEANLQLEALLTHLETLSPKYKKAFILKHVVELSHEKIAESLSIGLSASKLRVQRARHKLQQRVEEEQS